MKERLVSLDQQRALSQQVDKGWEIYQIEKQRHEAEVKEEAAIEAAKQSSTSSKTALQTVKEESKQPQDDKPTLANTPPNPKREAAQGKAELMEFLFQDLMAPLEQLRPDMDRLLG